MLCSDIYTSVQIPRIHAISEVTNKNYNIHFGDTNGKGATKYPGFRNLITMKPANSPQICINTIVLANVATTVLLIVVGYFIHMGYVLTTFKYKLFECYFECATFDIRMDDITCAIWHTATVTCAIWCTF